ncbi:hypothetical protein HOLleu_43406 [Holothuria leucospilota]|uniref:Uncharacterized protein n=1 Tax=Holothuria leucospilota TaxID=206669 RepID=A0A9Q1BBL2_HOLLE|nr:hypothetical protein HOLleu_43406 [Holothuria leucospilota]
MGSQIACHSDEVMTAADGIPGDDAGAVQIGVNFNRGEGSQTGHQSDESIMFDAIGEEVSAVKIGTGMNRGEGSQNSSHRDESKTADDTGD